jgi:rhamnosyltransferase subunit B
MIPFGTAGDVYPLTGIGVELKKRGHAVTVITHSHFHDLIPRFGLNYVDLDDSAGYCETMNHPDHWDPKRGLKIDARFLLGDSMRKHYAAIEKLYVPGETVAVTSHGGYGVRIAQDKLGIPVVSAHITPCLIRSVARPFTQPVADWTLRLMLFRFERDLYFRFVDRFLADPLLGPEINKFRDELGLPPVRRIIHRWIHSPHCILGLFPRWLAEPIPDDWPKIQFTGFPFFDEADCALPDDAEQFLRAGDPPIVFTPGTGVAHANHFFEAAIYACERLKKRALFLTKFLEQLPAKLPESIRHYPFLPLSQTLPRSAALVSHGGIGTAAQALRAGIPQLTMPMSYEQPENSRRFSRMGIARSLSPNRFHGPAVTEHLDYLLNNPEATEKCRALAATFPQGNPVKSTCDALEEFADRVASQRPADHDEPRRINSKV